MATVKKAQLGRRSSERRPSRGRTRNRAIIGVLAAVVLVLVVIGDPNDISIRTKGAPENTSTADPKLLTNPSRPDGEDDALAVPRRDAVGESTEAEAVALAPLVVDGEAAISEAARDSGSKPSTTDSTGPSTTATTVSGLTVEPGVGFSNSRGTGFSTYGATDHALRWMQSSSLIFNKPLPSDTPKVSNSTSIARVIDEVVRGERLYDYGSGIEETGNAPYMLLIDSDAEDFSEVRFTPQTCGSDTWWNWSSQDFGPYINGAYQEIGKWGIPLPAAFQMSSHDSDFHLMVYDWRRDVLTELWKAKSSNLTGRPGIEACWGGVIKDFSQRSSGIFPFPVGADAAGLTAAGLTITLEDVRRGSINHAIGVSTEFVINNSDGASFSYPASRNDGGCSSSQAATPRMREVAAAVGGSQNCLYEGQFLRFPKDFDVDSIAHPFARMIARAGRDYGFVVHDVAGCFCLQAESGYSVSENGFGPNPWDVVYAGTPEWEIMWQIDWTKLEVLPKDWAQPDNYRIPCTIPPGRNVENMPLRSDPRCQAPTAPYRSE